MNLQIIGSKCLRTENKNWFLSEISFSPYNDNFLFNFKPQPKAQLQ